MNRKAETKPLSKEIFFTKTLVNTTALKTQMITVPHPDVFWAYHHCPKVSKYEKPQMVVVVRKYSIFDALNEEYLPLEKIFVLKYLQTISFSFYMKSTWKNCWKNFFW